MSVWRLRFWEQEPGVWRAEARAEDGHPLFTADGEWADTKRYDSRKQAEDDIKAAILKREQSDRELAHRRSLREAAPWETWET